MPARRRRRSGACRRNISRPSAPRRAASASCAGKCEKPENACATGAYGNFLRAPPCYPCPGRERAGMNRGTGAAVLVSCALAGCAQAPIKPAANHIRAEEASAPGAIPPPVQVTPVLPKPKPVARPETYSVVVNNVRVQELLFALARDARLQIDIDPNLTGSVTLNAIDQTLPQLLTRIMRQVDMRYEIDGDTLIVMRDSPFLRAYRIDYLSASRNVKMQSTASTQFGQSASGPNPTGATSTIEVAAQNNPWDSNAQNVM